MSIINTLLKKMWKSADRHNDENILRLLDENPEGALCDLGCDDGTWTIELAKKMNTKRIFGVEITAERKKIAEGKGIVVHDCDLNKGVSFDANYFDVVHANQVIEHLHDTSVFVKEIRRILKPGGYAVISTENASSWHNIFALCLGWQMFSLTNIDWEKGPIGNPLAIHKNDARRSGDDQNGKLQIKSWEHERIFSYRGLKEIFEAYGFVVDAIMASGYYPLPWWLAKVDPRHGHFMAMRARKPIDAARDK